jgi:nucleoid-associated protein EbfC
MKIQEKKMTDQPNLQDLMKKAKEMQERMKNAQDELSHMEIIGQAGAGMAKVTMNGRHEAIRTSISDEALKEKKEVLEDLITAAINDASRKIEKASQSKIVDLTKSMGLPADFTSLSEDENQ